jgi:hypothetical protein
LNVALWALIVLPLLTVRRAIILFIHLLYKFLRDS